MRASFRTRGAILAATLVAATTAHANRYTLVDLGPALQEAHLNDSAQVAGTVWSPDGIDFHATLWTGAHWHKLSTSDASAEALNADGDVVGQLGMRGSAVLWRRHQAASVLPMPGDATESAASGINAGSDVVGYYVAVGHARCFKWSPAAGSVDLGLMPRGLECNAVAINDQGQITGDAATHGYDRRHAFRYDAGVLQDLGALTPGGQASLDFSQGVAINAQGDIAGSSRVHGGHSHAVVWRAADLVDLHRGTSYDDSRALDINDGGVLVGWVWQKDTDKQSAVRFTDPGVVLLDAEVSNLGRWHVLVASGVNRQGDIVGRAVGPKGAQRAVLLRLESAD
jgi:probable HAF family extracellular repeat protein